MMNALDEKELLVVVLASKFRLLLLLAGDVRERNPWCRSMPLLSEGLLSKGDANRAALISEPIAAHPDYEKMFLLKTDESIVCAVLVTCPT